VAGEPGAVGGRGRGGGAYESQSQARLTPRLHSGKRLGRKEKWKVGQVRGMAEAGEGGRPRADRKHNSHSHSALGCPTCGWP